MSTQNQQSCKVDQKQRFFFLLIPVKIITTSAEIFLNFQHLQVIAGRAIDIDV